MILLIFVNAVDLDGLACLQGHTPPASLRDLGTVMTRDTYCKVFIDTDTDTPYQYRYLSILF